MYSGLGTRTLGLRCLGFVELFLPFVPLRKEQVRVVSTRDVSNDPPCAILFTFTFSLLYHLAQLESEREDFLVPFATSSMHVRVRWRDVQCVIAAC